MLSAGTKWVVTKGDNFSDSFLKLSLLRLPLKLTNSTNKAPLLALNCCCDNIIEKGSEVLLIRERLNPLEAAQSRTLPKILGEFKIDIA